MRAVATSFALLVLVLVLLGVAHATTPSTKNPKPLLSPCAWSIELSPTAANALLPDGGARSGFFFFFFSVFIFLSSPSLSLARARPVSLSHTHTHTPSLARAISLSPSLSLTHSLTLFFAQSKKKSLSLSFSHSYWVTPLVESNALSSILPIKGTLDIRGSYPSARYFSFVTYTATGQVFDSIVDFQIPPQTPGTNPFATKGAAAGAPYSLRLVEANGTQAAEAKANGQVVLLVPKPAGTVLYRIYGADPNTNATGGQPLPSLVSTTSVVTTSTMMTTTSATTNASTTTLVTKTTPPCSPNKISSGLAVGITSVVATAVATRVPPFAPRPQPLFARTNSSAGGLFYPNPDNAYLTAFTDFSVPNRQLALWRGEMFLYPDTQAGADVPPPPPRDVRFSSLCHYKHATPFPLVSCASDWQMTLDNLRR